MNFVISDRMKKKLDRQSNLHKQIEEMDTPFEDDNVGDDEHSDTIYNFKEPTRLQDQRRFFFQPKDYQTEDLVRGVEILQTCYLIHLK